MKEIQGSFGSNDLHLQRADIKLMIDRLTALDTDYFDEPVIEAAISMLEDLGNLVNKLQTENAKLKQDILQLEAMIDD